MFIYVIFLDERYDKIMKTKLKKEAVQEHAQYMCYNGEANVYILFNFMIG